MTDLWDRDAALLAGTGRAAEAAALARPARRQLDPLQAAMGLPPPVWLNDVPNKSPDGRCVLYSGTRRCSATATHWAWIGCTLGEHIDRSGVCERHSRDVLKLPVLHCKRCWDALNEVSDARVIKIERIGNDDAEAADRRLVGLLPPHAPYRGRPGGVPVAQEDQAAGTGEVPPSLHQAPQLMGSHDKHLPPRRHLNKAVEPRNPLTGKAASPRALQEMSRGQGKGTKNDAKKARKGDDLNRGER